MNHKDYRPDIDGLRALAVLCVVFFHAGFPAFGGGFTGVDVFFVISGFLITRLIRDEFDRGAFSFSHFYVRRARRLLPALFFIYVLCFICAYILLIPEHFERFGKELLSSVLSVSNIYFWSEADYFDIESIFKPLLHTWSLSVEEQFYLLWPVTFIYLLKKRKAGLAPLAIIIAGMASLALNQVFIEKHAAIFYLIPFRVFEFCIGALMVWLVAAPPRKKILLEPLMLLGLALIMYAATTYSKGMAFPGFSALVPCLGTALVIYSGTARYSGRLLNNRLMVFIGLISYSLYLTHWPMIVFYKYYRFEDIGLYETWGVLTLSFLLSVAMYYFIELPCRKGSWIARLPARQLGACCLGIALVIAFGGAVVSAKHGLPRRINHPMVSAEFTRLTQYKSCDNGYGICQPDDNTELKNPDFVMIGDSHTNRMVYLFGAIAASHGLTVEKHTTLACLPIYDSGLACANEINNMFDALIKRKIRNIILVSSWNPLTQSYQPDFLFGKMKRTIATLKAAGMNVYVYGSMPFMHRDPASCFKRPMTSSCTEFMPPPEYEQQAAFNRQLKTIVLENGAKYFDLFAVLCDAGRCRVAYEGLSLYGDRFHLDNLNFGAYVFMTRADPKTLDFDGLFNAQPTP